MANATLMVAVREIYQDCAFSYVEIRAYRERRSTSRIG